jgi:LemA protein
MIITIFISVSILAIFFIYLYNTLVRKKNAIDQAYYSIDVQLKKRYELIPMIVDAVKGYMAHEKDLLVSLTKIRVGILNGNLSVNEKVRSDNQINQYVQRVIVLAENYPSLKSSASFIHLQGALNESEEQLAASRRFLNAAVADYHNIIHMFPSNLVAELFKMKERNYFEIKEEEKARPVLYINKPE